MSHKPEAATPGVQAPKTLKIGRRITVPHAEFHFDYTHSSGPGGQNVNKLNTKAVMHWDLRRSAGVPDDVRTRFAKKYAKKLRKDGVVVLSSQKTRDAIFNQHDCVKKLKEMLVTVATAPKMRKKTKPTREGRERRLETKHLKTKKKSTRKRVSIE